MIEEIVILDYGSTEPHEGMDYESSVETVKKEVIHSQSTDVDAVSGATKSTLGFKRAVNIAINSAVK